MRTPKARAASTVVAALIVGIGMTGCQPRTLEHGAAPLGGATADHGGSALSALDRLTVRPDGTISTYRRLTDFGPAWTDDTSAPGGHDGCRTRDDILERDLTHISLEGKCEVKAGQFTDPYTGKTLVFHEGRGTSEQVEIDHVVALGNAWMTGASALSQSTREEMANDPLELEASYGPANTAKEDDDASAWLPPAKSYRCEYVARQIAVKVKYRLWVTSAEKTAMQRVLNGCRDQQLPTESSPGVKIKS